MMVGWKRGGCFRTSFYDQLRTWVITIKFSAIIKINSSLKPHLRSVPHLLAQYSLQFTKIITKMSQQPKEAPRPIAMLVIYDVGFKFKYKKYYLRYGSNFIGSHHNCQVVMADAAGIPERAAHLYITEDLAVIQPLGKGFVHVLSNIKKKSNTMVELEAGTKYVIEMQKDFLICGRKALMQISNLQQLLLVRGVINENLFDISPLNKVIPKHEHFQDHYENNNTFNQFEGTIPLDSISNFEATIPLQNNYQNFEATQLIDQPDYNYDPTLPLDYQQVIPNHNKIQHSLVSSVCHRNIFSGIKPSLKMDSSNNNKIDNIEAINSNNRSQAEFSMPQTIKQNEEEMPATIKQDDRQNEDIFPPTIQEDDKVQHIKRRLTNLTKSQPIHRQQQREKFQKQNTKVFHSYEQRKPAIIDSFEDLFGGIDTLNQSNRTVSLKSSISRKQDEIKANKGLIKETNSEVESEKTEKLDSENENENEEGNKKSKRSSVVINRKKGNLFKIDQVNNDESQKIKRCFIVGKPNKAQLQKISKAGFQLASEREVDNLDFQVLLIDGQLKLSKILLLSLIKGMDIQPASVIGNPKQNKITGKLEGFLWENIQKRKGRGKNIFSNRNSFFLQQQLRQEYEQVLLQSGANLIKQLNKSRSKLIIFLIVDQKSEGGKALFEEKKNYKNWSFYSKRLIIESVLMGEEVIEKYKLDSYSF